MAPRKTIWYDTVQMVQGLHQHPNAWRHGLVKARKWRDIEALTGNAQSWGHGYDRHLARA